MTSLVSIYAFVCSLRPNKQIKYKNYVSTKLMRQNTIFKNFHVSLNHGSLCDKIVSHSQSSFVIHNSCDRKNLSIDADVDGILFKIKYSSANLGISD